MPDATEYRDVPFHEAIDFFRDKLNMPSPKWTDLLAGQHARAFTVAGAVKDGMLTDFRAAIDDAIANGTTIADFRKKFDDIVQRYGWDYNGGRGWRTRVIYQTNLSTAYSAGRYRQMTDPDVLRYQPYWRYRHADGVKHPRPQHLAWDGMVLRASDPWWRTHYPPNGWGCHCYVEPISERELREMGKTGPDTAPPITYRQVMLNTSNGPVPERVPQGIDPGWGYNVGDAAYGRDTRHDVPLAGELSRRAADALAAEVVNEGDWVNEMVGDWRSARRPEFLPPRPTHAAIGGGARDAAQLASLIERAIGGKTVALALPTGDTVTIDAAALADHLARTEGGLGRAPYIALLPALIAEPEEIWATLERNTKTDQYRVRQRVVKVIDIGPRGLTLVVEGSGGLLAQVSFFLTRHPDRAGSLDRVRVGRLLYARGE